ncbi:MAG: hypothetical protein ACOYVK_06990 [Bacillota bacterium]
MKKAIVILLTIVLATGLVAGCQKKPEETPKPPAEDQQNTDQNDQNNENVFEDVEGVYVGQIDSNSIEIMIDGEPMAFRTEKVQDAAADLEENDKVIITYEKNEFDQLILTKIEKAE